MHKDCVFWALWVLSAVFLFAGADERPVVPAEARVQVQYQYRNVSGGTWSTSSTTLKGAVSESMMISQLSQRHPGREIRVLGARVNGKSVRSTVRYQYRRGERPWNSSTATLQDALTESMARNQLSVRHPGQEIRILGMTPR